jgi:hypothetical protein
MWLLIIDHWGMDINGFSTSCSTDVSYVGRIESSIYCNALLGRAMVFISPLLDVICSQMLILNRVKTQNTLLGGQDCCRIVLFFRGPMFELQPCHYYEGFSQCF